MGSFNKIKTSLGVKKKSSAFIHISVAGSKFSSEILPTMHSVHLYTGSIFLQTAVCICIYE